LKDVTWLIFLLTILRDEYFKDDTKLFNSLCRLFYFEANAQKQANHWFDSQNHIDFNFDPPKIDRLDFPYNGAAFFLLYPIKTGNYFSFLMVKMYMIKT
jgi:hypothetical protein